MVEKKLKIEWPVELPPINLWSWPPLWWRKDKMISEKDLEDYKGDGYKQPSANDKQEGGRHYKKFAYQPWDVVLDWQLGYLDGTALKYIARWKDKGGIEDIKKAIHFLEKLVEVVAEAPDKEGIVDRGT